MVKRLAKVVDVLADKCRNCHACIAVCPAKYCNRAVDGTVTINPSLCIGCGQCLEACTHGARVVVDDLDQFLTDAGSGQRIVAVIAPAVAASFPHRYLNLNGWLRSLGVEACFDVSFGAELTVRSYLEHIKQNNPRCVISQPCPAIVTYIEIYRPKLLPYLAPADSPMLHTARMIREYYREHAGAKIVVISPCTAKKREFEETGVGDYNVTMRRLAEHLKARGVDLGSFPTVEYDNPPAERAVLFSTPGGLLATAERWDPNVRNVTRKIEGPEVIYPYLDGLEHDIAAGKAPLLVDCLNCEKGCNGGTGTVREGRSFDELERLVEERDREMRRRYRAAGVAAAARTKGKIESLIARYWRPGLYDRSYQDLSANFTVRNPTTAELEAAYELMGKRGEADVYNCPACGYGSCERMATAIHAELNVPENCYHFVATLLDETAREREDAARSQAERIAGISEAMRRIDDEARDGAGKASQATGLTAGSRLAAEEGNTAVAEMAKTIRDMQEASAKIGDIAKVIDSIAFQTNLLALNAAVEAARAGGHGRGFAVVADEVRRLAARSADAAKETSGIVNETIRRIKTGAGIAGRAEAALQNIASDSGKVADLLSSMAEQSKNQADDVSEVTRRLQEIGGNGAPQIR